jgi:hypothetical protein
LDCVGCTWAIYEKQAEIMSKFVAVEYFDVLIWNIYSETEKNQKAPHS